MASAHGGDFVDAADGDLLVAAVLEDVLELPVPHSLPGWEVPGVVDERLHHLVVERGLQVVGGAERLVPTTDGAPG